MLESSMVKRRLRHLRLLLEHCDLRGARAGQPKRGVLFSPAALELESQSRAVDPREDVALLHGVALAYLDSLDRALHPGLDRDTVPGLDGSSSVHGVDRSTAGDGGGRHRDGPKETPDSDRDCHHQRSYEQRSQVGFSARRDERDAGGKGAGCHDGSQGVKRSGAGVKATRSCIVSTPGKQSNPKLLWLALLLPRN